MTNQKSIIKRHNQSERRRIRNRIIKSKIKTAFKKAETMINGDNKKYDKTLIINAIKTISKAASKKVIHKRNASRKISKLMKKSNSINLII